MDSVFIFIIVILVLIYLILDRTIKFINKDLATSKEVKEQYVEEYVNFTNCYYKNKFIFTKTEYYFYLQLLKVLENTEYTIFTKVGLEDIFVTRDMKDNYKYYNKIKFKHVDFVICKNIGEIVVCIELDDYSHNTQKNKEKDRFKDKLFYDLKLRLFRYNVAYTYDFTELKKYLNIN